jgi:hypothetical protein
MGEKLHTIAIMAAILKGSSNENFDCCEVFAESAANLYEAVEAQLSMRRVTPQG